MEIYRNMMGVHYNGLTMGIYSNGSLASGQHTKSIQKL